MFLSTVEFKQLAEYARHVGCDLPSALCALDVPGESLEQEAFRLTSSWLSCWESLEQSLRDAVLAFLEVEDEHAAIVALAGVAIERACAGGRL